MEDYAIQRSGREASASYYADAPYTQRKPATCPACGQVFLSEGLPDHDNWSFSSPPGFSSYALPFQGVLMAYLDRGKVNLAAWKLVDHYDAVHVVDIPRHDAVCSIWE